MCIENIGRLAAHLKLPSWKKVLRMSADCLIFLVLAVPAIADEAQLTLGEAERLATEQEPGQLALLARADALAQRAKAAGELPLPQWRAGMSNYPVAGGGFDSEPMTMAQVGIQQMFPAGESREIRRQMLLTESQAVTSRAAGRTEFVREGARLAWLDVFYWTEATSVIEETRPWLEDLHSVVRSHYEAGHKSQKDLVRAELEIAKIDQRLLDMRREQAQARAKLSQWIGDAAYRPIAAVLPEVRPTPQLSSLLQNLRSHPELRAAEERVAASDKAVGLARESFKAGWGLGLTYGFRSGTAANGRDRSDMVTVQVTRDLPFLGRKQQNSSLAAALSDRQATSAELEENHRRLSAMLKDAYVRYVDLEAQIAQQQERVVKLAQFEAAAALAAYQNDRGEFSDLVMARVQVLQSRLDLIRLQVAQAKAYATIANLGGAQS